MRYEEKPKKGEKATDRALREPKYNIRGNHHSKYVEIQSEIRNRAVTARAGRA